MEYKKIVRKERVRTITLKYTGNKNVHVLNEYDWITQAQNIIKKEMAMYNSICFELCKTFTFKSKITHKYKRVVVYKEIK